MHSKDNQITIAIVVGRQVRVLDLWLSHIVGDQFQIEVVVFQIMMLDQEEEEEGEGVDK